MKSIHTLTGLALTLLISAFAASAATLQTQSESTLPRPWSVALQTRYFFHSHTSYEFGNPFPPNQSPLSRLEFPLNSWWAGGSARREFSRLSLGMEIWRNLSPEPYSVMADSDWDDGERPHVRTIYSESSCRMDPSYMVHGDLDVKIADWLGLPGWLDIRPAMGLRWQRFSLVTQNGMQYTLTENNKVQAIALPGDGIRFEQTYWQFFLGFKAAFDLGQPFHLSRLHLLTAVDWAYVDAKNEDWHLLRAGKRMTYEHTRGNAWRAGMDLKIGLTQNWNATVGAQYLYIRTTGNHQLVNECFGTNFSFDYGVNVWSRQISVTAGLEYLF